MTTPETAVQEKPQSDKELNFRRLEAQLAQVKQERLELEQRLAQQAKQDDEDDGEPYVDQKKLEKTLNKHAEKTGSDIKKSMDLTRNQVKEELRQEMWAEANPDFADVLQKHADAFAQKNPKLAQSILRMPDSFERQKLVYENIKALGIDKPEEKKQSIQEQIEAKRKSPYYQPSSIGAAPYAQVGDFSNEGQKNAYQKMQDLKKKMRLG